MSRRAQAFKQTDASKAMKAAQRAGLSRYRLEIEPGKISVIVDNGSQANAAVEVEDAAALIP